MEQKYSEIFKEIQNLEDKSFSKKCAVFASYFPMWDGFDMLDYLSYERRELLKIAADKDKQYFFLTFTQPSDNVDDAYLRDYVRRQPLNVKLCCDSWEMVEEMTKQNVLHIHVKASFTKYYSVSALKNRFNKYRYYSKINPDVRKITKGTEVAIDDYMQKVNDTIKII